jgi:hypothetical protein
MNRGVGSGARLTEALSTAHETVLCVVRIESEAAVSDSGVDVLFVATIDPPAGDRPLPRSGARSAQVRHGDRGVGPGGRRSRAVRRTRVPAARRRLGRFHPDPGPRAAVVAIRDS